MDDPLPLPDGLGFTPVPSASTRHDGWTPAHQRAFIEQLARIGVVRAAARAVGRSAKSAYALRQRAGPDSGFACAWGRALAQGHEQALDPAIDRALTGEATPIFYRGRQVGERRRYDNGLLIAALRALHARGDDRDADSFRGPDAE